MELPVDQNAILIALYAPQNDRIDLKNLNVLLLISGHDFIVTVSL